jgi:hypothetical protein
MSRLQQNIFLKLQKSHHKSYIHSWIPNPSPMLIPRFFLNRNEQRQGFCKPLAQCAIFYAEIPTLLETPCDTRSGQKGVCCPVENQSTRPKPGINPGVGTNGVLTPPPPPQVVIPRISRQELENIAEKSVEKFRERVDRITDILFNKKVNCARNCFL